jgi:alkylation response protein AidB-like acyl-CoA dehydrogenase
MDVRLSPEQVALRDSAAQVVDRLGPKAVGQLADTTRRDRLEAAVLESGWRELRSTDEDGAPWASAVEVALVAEQLARGCADVPFLGPTLALELRRLAGAPPSSRPETIALTSDLSSLASTTRDRAVAVDAGLAEQAIVIELGPTGYVLAEVPVAGVDAGVDAGIDLTRPTIPVALSSAVELIRQGHPITGDDITGWTALGLSTATADLVGAMQGALDLTVEYASQRQQFGRPIGSFQAVQHLMADMVSYLEGTRSTALHAAWAVDALEPDDALGYAAAAAAYAARSARIVCETAIQVHAGIGNTWECMAHVFLRRSQLASDFLGGVGTNLARVLEHVGIGGL